MTLIIHVVAGSLGLLAGYVALYSAKGGSVHRKAGRLFVYAMLTMCTGGLLIAVVRGVAPAINIPAALLTAYLVITALLTVRPLAAGKRWVLPALMLVALSVGVTDLVMGFGVIADTGQNKGMGFPLFLFGVVGVLGAAGDLRIMRSGALEGARRLRRHLWRMSFALFIAALSFFIGQADVIPKPMRIRPLLALPVLAVLLTMLFWLWRVRVPRPSRYPGVGAMEIHTVIPAQEARTR
jgi:hypothetical protein